MTTITIVSIYPTILGTYGDGGNVAALKHLAVLHGLNARIHMVSPGQDIPRQGDIYVLGGGEDTAQVAAAQALRESGSLSYAVENGAAVFAVCAGYQLLGHEFPDATGKPSPGLGLLDVTTDRLPKRAVGELLALPSGSAPELVEDYLTGYENHGGATHIGSGAQPLATVTKGVGNGDGTEGAVAGRVIGTYLHGPGLVRNPRIAEQLLSWAADRPLEHLVEEQVQELRKERISFALKK